MYLYYMIATLSILLFLHGFFPIPTRSLPKTYDSNVTRFTTNNDKVVLVVIDALRLDFISAQLTPFVWKAYQTKGCFNTLKVENPTVTLPRIKALTTGNVPQFVDVILNLADPAKVDDSFVHRAKASRKKIVFYGDDIWLRLFPEEFERSEGTTSFFVNDFIEVDDNVTRNVRKELKQSDWDIMILHYLGLDHIGHVYGPKSPLVPQKLQEMDNIIEEIYNHTSENTVILITGDHGMRDSGGHGGSTFPETHVPFIVLRMSCLNTTFTQIDIPANLAILLNFQIPSSSIGQLQTTLLQSLPFKNILNALKYNTHLLEKKLNLCQDDINTASYFHQVFLLSHKKEHGEEAAKIYMKCSKIIAEELLKTSVQQNLGSLIIAAIMLVCVMIKIGYYLFGNQANRLEQTIMIGIIALQFLNSNYNVTLVLIFVSLVILLYNIKKLKHIPLRTIKINFWMFLNLLHPITLLSSSFLEEEHQFWYFIMTTYILHRSLNKKDQRWFAIVLVLRFIKSINQVGDKWAAEPDLADWLLQADNKYYLYFLFALALCFVYYNQSAQKSRLHRYKDIVVLFNIFIFRTIIPTQHAQLWGLIAWFLILIKFVFSKIGNIVYTFVLIITLLMKPHNVILIPFCCGFSFLLSEELFDTIDIAMVHWWLGNLLYFAQGHDNSLASIDISTGYVGLSEYSPWLVIPQVFCHTYAMPILTNMLFFRRNRHKCTEYIPLFVIFRLYVVIVVFFVVFVQRNHLFVWSVFAPKLIVESSHFGCLFIQVTFYYIFCSFNKLQSLYS